MPGSKRPRGFGPVLRVAGRLAYFLLLLLLGAAFLGLVAIHWLSDGVRLAGPEPYEGLLHVDGSNATMRFTRAELLRENERLRSQGRQKSELFCVEASPPLRHAIEEAVKPLTPERLGDKALWVRFVAERRLVRSSCSKRRAVKGNRRGRLETVLRIASIEAMRPLGCDSLLFRASNLSCPEAKRGPVRVHVEDKDGLLYPAAARLARKEGSTLVRLLADGSNQVLSCDVAESSGDAALDAGACALLRARPDLVRAGRTEGLATGVREVEQRVTWRLGPARR
jgi:TonB family protein